MSLKDYLINPMTLLRGYSYQIPDVLEKREYKKPLLSEKKNHLSSKPTGILQGFLSELSEIFKVDALKAISGLFYSTFYIPYKLSYFTHLLKSFDSKTRHYEEKTFQRGLNNIFYGSVGLILTLLNAVASVILKYVTTLKNTLDLYAFDELYELKNWPIWTGRLIQFASYIALHSIIFAIQTTAWIIEGASRIIFGFFQLVIALPVMLSHNWRNEENSVEPPHKHIDPLARKYMLINDSLDSQQIKYFQQPRDRYNKLRDMTDEDVLQHLKND